MTTDAVPCRAVVATSPEVLQPSSHEGMLALAAVHLQGALWSWRADVGGQELVQGSMEELWGVALATDPQEFFTSLAGVVEARSGEDFGRIAARLPESLDYRIHIRHPRKGMRWLRIRTQAVAGGRSVGLASDVTEEVHRRAWDLEQQHLLKRADRLATLGVLSASLVHDLNHSLNNISLSVGLLEQWIRQLDPLLAAFIVAHPEAQLDATELTSIREQMPTISAGVQATVRRMVALHTYLRRYAKGSPMPVEEVAIGEVIADVVSLVRPYLDRAIVACSITLPTIPARVRTHRMGLEQVLTNLLTNAAEALAEGGGTIAITATTSATGGVVISVTDDGPGISSEAQQRLGLDFFTTRQDGTGLGWVIIRRVVDEMGGTLAIHSQPGNGTTVALTLPHQPEPVGGESHS